MRTPALPRRALGALASLALACGATAGAYGALVVDSAPAGAATTIGPVNASIADGQPNSLRDVLENKVADGDTVVLQAGATYTLDVCEPPPPILTSTPQAANGTPGYGDIEIPVSVTIQGNGATIKQTCDERVLYTHSALTIDKTTVTGGNDGGDGGGLWTDASLVLTGVTFTGNAAEGHGGGVYAGATATVSGSTFSQNIADSNVGGFGGGGGIYSAATLTVSGSTFTNNVAHGTGGDSGGGGITSSGPSLTVDTTTFSGNSSDRNAGGAILTAQASSDAAGDGGVIKISSTTINGNSAPVGGAYANYSSEAAITFTNSTITGNTTGDAGDGAIAASGDGATGVSLTLVNDTITNNVIGTIAAPPQAGAADSDAPAANARAAQLSVTTLSVNGTYRPFGTVLTGSGGADCSVAGDAVSQGYNYGDDATCGFTATTDVVTTTSPALGALAANGGPTQTQLPAAGSPLLDKIPSASCQVTVDQRGITRPQGTGCDIGAVEVVVEPTPAATVVITPRFTG